MNEARPGKARFGRRNVEARVDCLFRSVDTDQINGIIRLGPTRVCGPYRSRSRRALGRENPPAAARATERINLRAMVSAGINAERRNAQQSPRDGRKLCAKKNVQFL